MSNKHKPRYADHLIAALLIAGIALTILGSRELLQAKDTVPTTSQGALTVIAPGENEQLAIRAATHLAAPIQTPSAGPELLVGMILILLGFGLHTLLVMRNAEERPVPVRAKKRNGRKPGSYIEMLRIEIRR